MKLSIITINLNNHDGLQKTIDSVVSQTFKDFEWIVIDGGSTDGGKELIEQYSDHFAYWVSEPDKGIYNAMNKGIKRANGEYLLFLNSGDWLCDEFVLQDFNNASFDVDIVGGDIFFIFGGKMEMDKAPESVGFDHLFHNTLWHPSSFIKKDLFKQYGLYEERYRIISDWEFFLRTIVVYGVSYAHFNRVVSCFPVDGISANPSYEQEIESDIRNAYLKYIPEGFLNSYKKLDEEVLKLRREKPEFDNLKKGKSGFIVRAIIKHKKRKNR